MGKKILVIDDDPNIVTYLTTFFEDNAFKTCHAGDVEEGLKIAKKEIPDLITLDLDLPGEWGPRFFRKMDEEPMLRNIPVIVISGLTGNEFAVSKAVASLTKPFDRNELLKIVRDTLID